MSETTNHTCHCSTAYAVNSCRHFWAGACKREFNVTPPQERLVESKTDKSLRRYLWHELLQAQNTIPLEMLKRWFNEYQKSKD